MFTNSKNCCNFPVSWCPGLFAELGMSHLYALAYYACAISDPFKILYPAICAYIHTCKSFYDLKKKAWKDQLWIALLKQDLLMRRCYDRVQLYQQSILDISNTDISKYPLISKNIVRIHFLVYFYISTPFFLNY